MKWNLLHCCQHIDQKQLHPLYPTGSTGTQPKMQSENEDFSDIWKIHTVSNPSQGEMTQPVYSFTDSTDELQNNLTLDVFTEFQQFTTGTDQSVTTETMVQANESSGYQCAPYPTNNGIIRTYSGDMTQQINQQNTIQNIGNNHQLGIHQMGGYQSTSPTNGDGSNSTHSSPFTSSPSQGFEYSTSPHVKPSIPPNTDYPGEYSFTINFGEATESAPKSAQYTYSHTLNKLFVKMNVTCPIRFKCEIPPPPNCTIRAIPVFKRPEHVTDVVTRCPNHKIPDEAHFMHRSGHLIRAEMSDDRNVRYDIANDHRESVSVLYERPQIGAEYTTVLYKFMCLSSCVGGINRRPLLTVFVLENQDGQVLGRRVVEVRICSCPGRDRSQEEKRKFNDASTTLSNGQDKNPKRPFKNIQGSMEFHQTVPGKKRRTAANSGDQEEFILKIRGREKYLMLKRVKEALDLMEYVTPQQQEAYRNKEDQDQAGLRQQLAADAATRRPTQPTDVKGVSTNASPPISTVFTVSNPIPGGASPLEPLLTPSHSSHPLTATPTGVLCTPPTEGYTPASTISDPASNFAQGSYWSVDGSQLGCDVPDTSHPAFTNIQSQPETSWAQQRTTADADVPCTSSPLCRELSGASTVSISSQSSVDEPAFGRYVTRVLLRQTVSLDRETLENKASWKPCDEKVINGDMTLDNVVKTVKEEPRDINNNQPGEGNFNFL